MVDEEASMVVAAAEADDATSRSEAERSFIDDGLCVKLMQVQTAYYSGEVTREVELALYAILRTYTNYWSTYL